MTCKKRRLRFRNIRPWPGAAGIVLFSLLFAAGPRLAPGKAQVPSRSNQAGQAPAAKTNDYVISAHLFIIGYLGDVGTMAIEESLRPTPRAIEKSLRMGGNSNADQVKRNRDYHGEFSLVKVLPVKPDGMVDEEAVQEWRGFKKSSSGFLKLNKRYQAENLVFFRDHAVSTRENGTERTVEGNYSSILAPLEYLLEHDIKVDQVIDIPFILNGVPRVFRLSVTDLVTLDDYKSKAYQIDIWAYDKVKTEEKPSKDVWRKKGNVRVWFCKEGRYRNMMLRMKIKFRWYLWLYFNLKP